MFVKLLAVAGAAALALGAVVSAAAPASSATTGFTVSGSQILDDGQPFTPLGFSVYNFGNGRMSFAKDEYASVTAQMRAIKNTWHGNTVRIQVEQDEYLYGGDGWSAQVFRDKVTAAINYAESLGLAVVLNDTTEATEGIYTRNEPGATQATMTFWRDIGRQNDPDVILDVFNEPRFPAGAIGDWSLLFSGNATYLGEDAQIRDLRAMGYHGQLWMEGTGNLALTELGVTWPRYRLTDSDHDFVYAYHHTAVDQSADPTTTEFNVQFGNLVTKDGQPVIDGEWTNRSNPPGTGGGVYEPSGDQGQCWGNAPASVPLYLGYLASRHIGMIVWALGTGPGPADQQYDMINADGDDTTFTTANNYAGWAGCQTPAGDRTSGAGQDIMTWFAGQDG